MTAATETFFLFLLSVGDHRAQMGAVYASFLRNISIRSNAKNFLFAVSKHLQLIMFLALPDCTYNVRIYSYPIFIP